MRRSRMSRARDAAADDLAHRGQHPQGDVGLLAERGHVADELAGRRRDREQHLVDRRAVRRATGYRPDSRAPAPRGRKPFFRGSSSTNPTRSNWADGFWRTSVRIIAAASPAPTRSALDARLLGPPTVARRNANNRLWKRTAPSPTAANTEPNTSTERGIGRGAGSAIPSVKTNATEHPHARTSFRASWMLAYLHIWPYSPKPAFAATWKTMRTGRNFQRPPQ